NLVEFIEVYKEGSTLVIHTKEGFDLDPSRELIVHVTAPAYRNIDASGQCEIIGVTPITGSEPLSIEVSGQGTISMQVDVPRLSTDISGQGDVFIKGRATEFFSEVSGSGTIKCLDLITDNTTLDISGSSDVEITANKQLNVDASGASTVHYRGNASVSQNTSGASTVKKVG
ncbi:MAG TPA: head GIN domain-containing protein, partial [Chitinophagaceae bacterium]|nr:head GIN domain-containing protein [Chitinophagaceae bacterium]